MLFFELFLYATLTLITGVKASLSYSDSLRAIANNQVSPNDMSNGTVYITLGDFFSNYGVQGLEDLNVFTVTSFHYLQSVASLCEIAAKRHDWADALMLYLKFAYSGQPNSSELESCSALVKDILAMTNQQADEAGEGVASGVSLADIGARV
ncbi:LAMI_0A08130g1_1 [Lachancea mirantina]|uniref:LAMI_0A08130g1_1 n=1 Tax=Lachancea mirantina TaxID=1230905 RepID=A0A1G4IRB3_9SACH|nr:LAMI_0A08130g1_1 [Lachancea mirantina]